VILVLKVFMQNKRLSGCIPPIPKTFLVHVQIVEPLLLTEVTVETHLSGIMKSLFICLNFVNK
jgi:hypothetical protein